MSTKNDVLVGYDESPSSELALMRAFEFASREHGEVHVVHVLATGPEVVLPGMAVALGEGGLAGKIEEARESLEDRVLELFEAWKTETGRSVSRIAFHLRFEEPAREIAQLAADLEVALVVVGTHGRRGWERVWMGSVAEGVLRLAPCPVLVVRPREVKEPVPAILPPCPRCVETRASSEGREFWCEQHRERHGQRHTYRYQPRPSQPPTAPLVVRM